MLAVERRESGTVLVGPRRPIAFLADAKILEKGFAISRGGRVTTCAQAHISGKRKGPTVNVDRGALWAKRDLVQLRTNDLVGFSGCVSLSDAAYPVVRFRFDHFEVMS